MPLIEINRNPSRRQLRQFGIVCAGILPLLGWLRGAGGLMLIALAVAGISVAAIAWAAPGVMKPLFVGLSLVTAPLGMLVGEAALLAIFIGVIIPMGLALRGLRCDPLGRRFTPESTSYWQRRESSPDIQTCYRQF